MSLSRRAEERLAREVRSDALVEPRAGLGLVAMSGPGDPEPSLVFEEGRILELDGRPAAEFDVLDRFVAAHGIDLDVAAEAMELADQEIARRLVDVDEPREELVRLSRGLTPARLARVVGMLDPVEMMFARSRSSAPAGGRRTRRTSRTARRTRRSSPPTPPRPRPGASPRSRRRSASPATRR